MQRYSELCLILKTYPFSERDLVVVLFSENHGKVTALGKGAIHSRRFGGSLRFLSASRVTFTVKPQTEMARLEEAATHHEFQNLSIDFERFTIASFMAEFSLRILEPYAPVRDFFIVLSNALVQLDTGLHPALVLNAFLCKSMHVLGYAPHLSHCIECLNSAAYILESAQSTRSIPFFWDQTAGGLICHICAEGHSHQVRKPLLPSSLQLFHDLTTRPFKELYQIRSEMNQSLFKILTDFMFHHIPVLTSGSGLKSLKLVEDYMHQIPNEIKASFE